MKVIGIGGYARCGKDTFVSIAKEILTKNGYKPVRFAFADALKHEVHNMLEAHDFSLDVMTTDTEAKKRIRPLLVWWGCARRDLSDQGLYWVNVVHKQLQDLHSQHYDQYGNSDSLVVLVSDVRFPNESAWIHKKWNGQVIHIRRWATLKEGTGDFTKVFDQAPNEEEAKNDPFVATDADVKIDWESRGIPTGSDVTQDEYLRKCVRDALNSTKYFKHTSIGTLSL